MEWAFGMMLVASSGLGFDSGAGLDARVFNRYFSVEAGASYQAKHSAESGVTWNGQALLTLPVSAFYVGAGYAAYGYRSKFADGSAWEKASTAPVAAIGYRGAEGEARLQYTFADQTYRTSAWSLETSYRVSRRVQLVATLQSVSYPAGRGEGAGLGIRLTGGGHGDH